MNNVLLNPSLNHAFDHGSDNNAADSVAALLGQVADEFTQRLNRGEQPDIEAYVQDYPDIAAVLRQVLPALQWIRVPAGAAQLASDPSTSGGSLRGCLGDFRIVREIGRGGMGVVYEAEQISLGRRVALKVLPFAAALDAKQLQRFKNEAQAAAHLHHTNIVPVFGIGCERGVHFYAMQYIDGQTLAKLIADLRLQNAELRNKAASHDEDPEPPAQPATQDYQPAAQALPSRICNPQSAMTRTPLVGALSTERSIKSTGYFRSVATLGVQAAEALEHAHQMGVVHRDIKPANLLVDVRGNLWITDFGLAHCQSQAGLTMTGDLVGTLRYMSPEQALAKRVLIDHRTDIYSLGVTLYELLTLEPAFSGGDRQELLRQIAFEEPSPLRRLNKPIPAELETIVLKAMEKNPAERYTTAQELAEDLGRFLEDKPIKAKRPTLRQRAAKWSRRHKPVVRAAVVVLLLGVAALAVSSALIWRAQARTEAANRDLETNLYFKNIALADREWFAKNPSRMEELLAQCPEDLRGWEWHYLKRRRLPSLPPMHHSSAPFAAVFSPDGRCLASGNLDGDITVWDAATGEESFKFRAHEKRIHGLAFSPDGRRLASAGWDGTVKIWDFEPLRAREVKTPVHTLLKARLWSVAFSPDGRRLACAIERPGGDGEVKVWDADTGQEVLTLTGHTGGVSRVAFSPDGRRLASAGDDATVKIWDAQSGRQILTFRDHSRPVSCVAFSPDGKRLASATADWPYKADGELKVWDAQTGKEALALRGHFGWIYTVAFSPDGRRLASAGLDGTIKLWDPSTGHEALTLRGHAACVVSLAFSADGNRLVSACTDRKVRVWDARPLAGEEAGQEVLTLRGHQESVRGVAFHPGGRYLASGGDDRNVRIWDLALARAGVANCQVRTLPGHTGLVTHMAFSDDGRLLVSAGAKGLDGQGLRVWNATTWKEIYAAPDVGSVLAGSAMALSPNGRYLATTTMDHAVQIRDAQTGREIGPPLRGNTWIIHDVAFSPDNRLVASASNDFLVRVWDVTTGQQVTAPLRHAGIVWCVAFSRDGRFLASAGLDRTVKIWDTKTWKLLHDLSDPSNWVLSVAFHPRDSRMLAWSGTDSTVKVCNLNPGDPGRGVKPLIRTLRGHKHWVESVAFSPDGEWLASASLDGTVKLWQVPPVADAPDPAVEDPDQ